MGLQERLAAQQRVVEEVQARLLEEEEREEKAAAARRRAAELKASRREQDERAERKRRVSAAAAPQCKCTCSLASYYDPPHVWSIDQCIPYAGFQADLQREEKRRKEDEICRQQEEECRLCHEEAEEGCRSEAAKAASRAPSPRMLAQQVVLTNEEAQVHCAPCSNFTKRKVYSFRRNKG